MNRLFLLTLVGLLTIQFFGVFHTASRRSTDFLFSPENQKTSNISVVLFNNNPTDREVNDLIDIIDSTNPLAIGVDVPNSASNINDLPNLIKITQDDKANFLADNDGKVREISCNNSFVLKVSKLVNQNISCLKNEILINYSLLEDNMDVIDARDILSSKRELPQSAVVLIGLNNRLGSNLYNTPISLMPISGSIVEANAINSLISDKQLVTMDKPLSLLLAAITLTIFYLVLSKIKFLKGLSVLVLILVVHFVFVYLLYVNNIILDYFYIPAGLIIIFITQLSYGYFSQNRSRILVEQAFSKYLNQKILDQLLKNPDKINLGGERKLISTLFVDIKSFTSISENKTSEELVLLLNNFLSFASDVIVANDGTLDKYVGDEVIAFWNAPIDQDNHTILAAKSAIEINKNVKNIVPHGAGIGLNTGISFVGNIGSKYLYDYTAIGDNINITSRLEKLTRLYGVPIIASESFVESVKSHKGGNLFSFRLLDKIKLKGKAKYINIYELLGFKEEIAHSKLLVIDRYEKAYSLYKKGDLKSASIILKKNQFDYPSRYLLKRITEVV